MTRDDNANDNRTRRNFLTATAVVGTAALAGCSGGGSGDETTTGMDTTMETTSEMMDTTTEETTTEEMSKPHPDLDVLNYALTLEHLENAFYREGLNTFSDDELMGADAVSKFNETVRMDVPEYLKVADEHEAAHVKTLSATIEKLGGTPVEEAEYDFGYETPSEYLTTAKALENTGVAAYAGAAPMIKDNDILGPAAGIHSVEARHASFLNMVNSSSPFPKAVDEAKSMDEVIEIASQFITSDMGGSETTQEMAEEPTADRKKDDGTGDVKILNYALTLEHLENAFYRDGLENFSDDELMNADVLSEYGDELRMTVPDRLRAVGEHEAAHVKAITNTVKKLGGTPVEEAEYDFGYGTASEFFGVAKALENTGVAAYKGAAPSVSNDDVFSAAIGIHSVEARHASFLNELNVSNPYPKAVDEPKTMKEVKEIAGQFIVQ
ncbi:ferritin-like domain-containing protein [Halorussus halophilus]|uniref:ferritin-like domain-containing protein n=1 Tax=Halorussus halophilus TaxID=2650975 RepID=UPI0013011E32|nr:ferritin-like domain-containing protein [Halorussus halophilus]